MAQAHSVMHITIRACFLCFFYSPYMSFLNFSFTCIYYKILGIKKGHIGIVEKAKETSSDSGMHNRAITVLHEQWMCPGMQRHTHITLCSMVTI